MTIKNEIVLEEVLTDISSSDVFTNEAKFDATSTYQQFVSELSKINTSTQKSLSGHLILFAGFSGSGKNTLIKEISKRNSEIQYLKSTTTRPIRDYEYENPPYIFTTETDFLDDCAAGLFLEYEKIHEHYYGTSKKELLNSLSSGKTLISDFGVEGCLRLKKEFPNNITIFFITPSNNNIVDTLKKRLELRGDASTNITQRLHRLYYESCYIKHFDALLVNDGSLSDLYIELEQTLTSMGLHILYR